MSERVTPTGVLIMVSSKAVQAGWDLWDSLGQVPEDGRTAEALLIELNANARREKVADAKKVHVETAARIAIRANSFKVFTSNLPKLPGSE